MTSGGTGFRRPAHLVDDAELDRVAKAIVAHTQRLAATLRLNGIR